MQTIIYILPELFLSLSIMTLLIVGVFVKNSFKIVNSLTILCLVFAVALVLNQPQETTKIFNNIYLIDKFSMFMKILILVFTLFILTISRDYLKKNDIDKMEYPIIIISSTLGKLLSFCFNSLPLIALG